LIKVPVPSPCSKRDLRRAMGAAMDARGRNVWHVVFGSFSEDIRAYRRKQLSACGMTPVFPLGGATRGSSPTKCSRTAVSLPNCVDPSKLDRSFAGADFDADLFARVPREVDPCGENGEFHTFAKRRPMFQAKHTCHGREIVDRDGFVFADFLPRASAPARIESKIRFGQNLRRDSLRRKVALMDLFLIAFATEILYALGLGDSVVGVTHECDFPARCYDEAGIDTPR